MNRRELLKAFGGLTLGACTLSLSGKALSQSSDRFWVFVSAGGGWDVTNQWDPKGSDVFSTKGRVNNYPSTDIRQVGNIRYAPVPEHVESSDMLHTFTQKHHQRMMVINGVDQVTNSHSVGSRLSTSGSTGQGIPVFCAMAAAPFASSQSMAFIHQGGNGQTAGLLAKSKVLKKSDYDRLANSTRFLDSEQATTTVAQSKRDLLQRLTASTPGDKSVKAMNDLQTARNSSGALNDLLNRIPGELNASTEKAAAEISAAAFASGAATSSSLRIGGFDTHSDNDQRQFTQMDKLLTLVDHLWEQLEFQGVAQNTTIVMCSDIGRKPYYDNNSEKVDAGKGHWSISSMVLMGAGIQGNTVVGGTDDNLKPIKVNPQSLQPDEDGIHITSSSVHDALRRLAGITGSELDLRYPLNADYINLFT